MTKANEIKITLTVTPCKNCKKRYLACHDDCEIYAKWQEKERDCQMKNRINNSIASCGWGYNPRRKK